MQYYASCLFQNFISEHNPFSPKIFIDFLFKEKNNNKNN